MRLQHATDILDAERGAIAKHRAKLASAARSLTDLTQKAAYELRELEPVLNRGPSNEPTDPTDTPAPVIPGGQAQRMMIAALANLAHTMGEVEALAMACARTVALEAPTTTT
jgi:hypothetical protein